MQRSSLPILVCALLAAAAAVSANDSRKAHVKHFDADGNGMLSPAERQAGREARFKAHDKNGDGRLSPDELVAGHMEWFDQQDKDKNGTVELAENLDFLCGTGKTRKTCVVVRTAIFKEGDTDQDGRHSAAERQAQVRGHHKKMDKDGDGFVAPGEFYTANIAPEKKAAGKPSGKTPKK